MCFVCVFVYPYYNLTESLVHIFPWCRFSSKPPSPPSICPSRRIRTPWNCKLRPLFYHLPLRVPPGSPVLLPPLLRPQLRRRTPSQQAQAQVEYAANVGRRKRVWGKNGPQVNPGPIAEQCCEYSQHMRHRPRGSRFVGARLQ